MQVKEFNVLLDIKRSRRQTFFEVVQGDFESNLINIALVDDEKAYDLTGLAVEIAFAKSDNTSVLQDMENGVTIEDPEKGKIKCVLKTNTIAAPGRVWSEVRILGEDNKLLTSTQFSFFVREAIVNDKTIESTNEYPILAKLVDDVSGVIVTEGARVAAESQRVQAENGRISAENIRQSNEAERKNNENDRITAEDARIAAEIIREQNEAIRQQNETERQASIADIEDRFHALTAEQQQDAEVIDARKGKASLRAKIDDIDSQLADIIQQTDTLEINKADKSEVALKTELAVERARIDNFVTLEEGSTTGDAELIDIRVTTDGTIEVNAGESVRKQIQKTMNIARTGIIRETKTEVIAKYDEYKNGYVPYANGVSMGETLDNAIFGKLDGATNYLIDVSGIVSIRYPMFKTTTNSGCLMVDENDIVIWNYANADLDTGSYKEVNIPPNAKYLVLAISPSLAQMDWYIEYPSEIKNKIDALNNSGENYSKAEILSTYGKYEERVYLTAVGTKNQNIADVTRTPGGIGPYLLKFDISKYASIAYPVFKSTSNFGSVIIDENDIVIWEHCETVEDTGTIKKIVLPPNSKYFIVGISRSLSSLDWSITFFKSIPQSIIGEEIVALYDSTESLKNMINSITPPPSIEDDNRNLCLCALKTDILDNKIPYHRGYLFHKLTNDDKSLWFGNNFDKIYKLGTVDFYPRDHLLAMSPKDGRVIATRRGDRSALYVWDGTTTTALFSVADLKPMGWLYNSGVDFINDSEGNEYCIFAEYDGSGHDKGGFYVWKGTYPYTSEENWKTVFYQDQGYYQDPLPANSVTHFHQIRRDPWTNVLYLTSGDKPSQLKWWYSTDLGETWTLLTDNADNGWEEHVCRCINFIFTKDYIYWAVDSGTNHSLNRIERDASTGIIDITTRIKLTDLPYAQATNSICYVDSPKGIFMFDRIDIGYGDYYDQGIDVQFWSLEDNELHTIMHIDFISPNWGGHRGKCYTNYTSGVEPRPAMGFSDDTRCVFDIVTPNASDIGTVFYEIKGKVLRTLIY